MIIDLIFQLPTSTYLTKSAIASADKDLLIGTSFQTWDGSGFVSETSVRPGIAYWVFNASAEPAQPCSLICLNPFSSHLKQLQPILFNAPALVMASLWQALTPLRQAIQRGIQVPLVALAVAAALV